jgi:hypothetical protein
MSQDQWRLSDVLGVYDCRIFIVIIFKRVSHRKLQNRMKTWNITMSTLVAARENRKTPNRMMTRGGTRSECCMAMGNIMMMSMILENRERFMSAEFLRCFLLGKIFS